MLLTGQGQWWIRYPLVLMVGGLQGTKKHWLGLKTLDADYPESFLRYPVTAGRILRCFIILLSKTSYRNVLFDIYSIVQSQNSEQRGRQYTGSSVQGRKILDSLHHLMSSVQVRKSHPVWTTIQFSQKIPSGMFLFSLLQLCPLGVGRNRARLR